MKLYLPKSIFNFKMYLQDTTVPCNFKILFKSILHNTVSVSIISQSVADRITKVKAFWPRRGFSGYAVSSVHSVGLDGVA